MYRNQSRITYLLLVLFIYSSRNVCAMCVRINGPFVCIKVRVVLLTASLHWQRGWDSNLCVLGWRTEKSSVFTCHRNGRSGKLLHTGCWCWERYFRGNSLSSWWLFCPNWRTFHLRHLFQQIVQESDETFDQFVCRVCQWAINCEFSENEN